MSKDWYEDMVEFEKEVMNAEHPETPTIPSNKVKELRKKIIMEEIEETFNAMEYDDMIEIADGIVDSIVLLIGTAIVYGIDIRPIWDEVHKTNMAKKGGALREDGKKMKPKNWQVPDIKSILVDQGWIE
jgi:predicted HAD superfamily Cof-like phosphohydrolase